MHALSESKFDFARRCCQEALTSRKKSILALSSPPAPSKMHFSKMSLEFSLKTACSQVTRELRCKSMHYIPVHTKESLLPSSHGKCQTPKVSGLQSSQGRRATDRTTDGTSDKRTGAYASSKTSKKITVFATQPTSLELTEDCMMAQAGATSIAICTHLHGAA